MPSLTTSDIRNVALVGHATSGKTLLAESILKCTGAISSMGAITKGNTVTDYDPLEKSHQRSLSSGVIYVDHDGKRINIVDTPGYPDFLGHALSSLPAAETAAVVIDARAGVQTVTTRMMLAAKERGMARMVVINKSLFSPSVK